MIGKKLINRYELVERIGGGGMAVVYKAKDLLLNRLVAVKTLRSEYSPDEDFVNRFRREAQAAASLSHPNIVNIYDVGVEDDIHFIVMEFIDGPTLKEYIAQRGKLNPYEAVDLTVQIAEALDHAHQNNIIHRDIKPHNILIAPGKRVKVTDFGIARAASSSTITLTGAVMGSVHYFSPEQARGGITDVKSDIYSLGVVLYEMVTGELPFSGDSAVSIALKHLQETCRRPRELTPELPQSVENIILRSLSKEQDRRYGSARELINDLKTSLHPDRHHEAPWEDDWDDQATKLVPVVSDDLFETKPVPINEQEDSEGTIAPDEPEEQKFSFLRNRNRWFRVFLVCMVIFLLGFGTYQGIKIYLAAQNIEVPDVQNLPVEQAINQLESHGLQVDASSERYHDEIKEGHVIRQNPVVGTMVPKGSTVRLTVSLGSPKIEMPSVINMSEGQARTMLKDFTILTETEHHDHIPEGNVISQDPEPMTLIASGETEVRLVISKGRPTFGMPDLTGRTLDEVQSTLAEKGLHINEIKEGYSDQHPEGTIYDQWPYKAGEEVEKGESIDVWISQGPEVKQERRHITVEMEKDDRDHPGRGRGKPGHSPVQLEIKVKDRGGERTVHAESITKTKTYPVDVEVTPHQPALIQVFLNGNLYHEEQVYFK